MNSFGDAGPRRSTTGSGGVASIASPTQPPIDSVQDTGPRTVWELLALSDAELEKVDIIEMNLAVARGIPGLEDLDAAKYQRVVDAWAKRIRAELPHGEAVFRQSPENWENDIRFFRLGQVAGYLDQEVGIVYIEDQKRIDEIAYTDPADLFIHGLIDAKEGTCGNMPTLHVAIGRRLGWPVSLAAVNAHTVCRFDDGQVVYNIEATHTDAGGMFSAGSDQDYIEEFDLPRRAITSGSDLNSMTARQMLGYFIALRARHFADTNRMDLADRDYALARALLPNHRRTWQASMEAAVYRGAKLFEPHEQGHPLSLARWVTRAFAPRHADRSAPHKTPVPDVERINAMNRMRMQQMEAQGAPGQPLRRIGADPYSPVNPNQSGYHHPLNPYGPPGSP